MEEYNIIFTLSGIRGRFEQDFKYDTVKKIAIAFGLLVNGKHKKVVIGRDTRPSGIVIEQAIIEGLILSGFEIINFGICPTPVIIHAKNKLNIPFGIIITGSHNPQEWNGLKLISETTFLNTDDLEIISIYLENIDLDDYRKIHSGSELHIKNLKPITEYIHDLMRYIDISNIREKNKLRVVIDSGAGAGNLVTPLVLEKIGCDTRLINNELLANKDFPREVEPIKENLRDLIMEVWQGKYDIGFAHDTDADRLAIIGENGECYPEDIGLAIITDYYFKNVEDDNKQLFFVTNLASSLRFEAIAEKYNAQVIRTPVGERFLTEKMNDLISNLPKNRFVFGGEGSCGGIMFPDFNNTRDGIFAAAKIIEIMVKTGKSISQLVSELPKYYSHRIKINITNVDISSLIAKLKEELINEGENVEQIENDLRFGRGKEWFVLIHPSNTEPIIRIISEAKRDSLARVYCEATSELVRLVISKR
jgi:phosphomannomutase